MLIYLCSPTLSQISLKKFFGKVVFQILAKIEMTIGYSAIILKRYNIFFFKIVIFFIVYTYMVQISLQKIGGKMFFLGGSMEPPWAPTGVKVPWSLKC